MLCRLQLGAQRYMAVFLSLVVLGFGVEGETQEVPLVEPACGPWLGNNLRWQALCMKKHDMDTSLETREYCKQDEANTYNEWTEDGSPTTLESLVAALVRPNQSPVYPYNATAPDLSDRTQVSEEYLSAPNYAPFQSAAPNTCNIHPFERNYWSRKERKGSWVVLHNRMTTRACWDVQAPSSYTSCVHRVERCVNTTILSDERCGRGDALGRQLHLERRLGGSCPTVAQLSEAFASVLRRLKGKRHLLDDNVANDFLPNLAVLVGDSIARGTGAFRFQKKKKLPMGHVWWRARKWANEIVGDTAYTAPMCLLAKDGLSMHKLRLDIAGKGISRHYYVPDSPKKLVKGCLKERQPAVAVLSLGVNEFLDGNSISNFEANLRWFIYKAQTWSRSGLKGLFLAVPPLPPSGKRELTAGAYTWRGATVQAVHRVAAWVLQWYNHQPEVIKRNATYNWVKVVDLSTPLYWCNEFNFADGIHPNARGHFLMALSFLRSMLKEPADPLFDPALFK